jgi:hypothetical protein
MRTFYLPILSGDAGFNTSGYGDTIFNGAAAAATTKEQSQKHNAKRVGGVGGSETRGHQPAR